MGYGGDPDLFPLGEDDLWLRADAELREAATHVERLMREDYERFLASSDEELRRSAKGASWIRRRLNASPR